MLENLWASCTFIYDFLLSVFFSISLSLIPFAPFWSNPPEVAQTNVLALGPECIDHQLSQSVCNVKDKG